MSIDYQGQPYWGVDYYAESCHAYDLRPAVRAIMGAENWILKRLPAHQKLVVILGEFHENYMHALLQKAVLEAHDKQARHYASRQFAFGIEMRHNYPELIREHMGLDRDPTMAETLSAIIRRNIENNTRWEMSSLLRTCLNLNLSVGFNDVAHYGPVESAGKPRWAEINQEEPFTRDLILRHAPGKLNIPAFRYVDENYRGSDRSGLALSNICMAERSIAHMEETGARIYVHVAGMAHALGNTKGGFHPYEESLSAQFLKRGCAVLPVLPNIEKWEGHLPRNAEDMLAHSVTIANMRVPCGPDTAHAFESIRYFVNMDSGYGL